MKKKKEGSTQEVEPPGRQMLTFRKEQVSTPKVKRIQEYPWCPRTEIEEFDAGRGCCK